ncbi:MAG TPA: plastocyanin/azurin family copper-binding protein [Gemmatimonadaceae bacterium]|nr:plastocyanin/azurin family copper-binding protein [Gemmatimonadaceae bacterium]
MRRKILLSLAIVALIGCSGDDSPTGTEEPPDEPDPTPPPATTTVSVQDNLFSPANAVVRRASGSARVTWQWYGVEDHSVTFDAGGPSSPAQSTGTFERTFTSAGAFTYYCTVHGRNVMSGTVTVQ